MLVSQAEIDSINGKARQRIMCLPVKHGRFGELKRCPMRPGGVYHLKPSIPYDRYRTIAERQPTRARTILRLVDLCLRHPVKTVAITVFAVGRQEDEWLVRFVRGEDRGLLDRPVFLAKYGDYTMTASKQAVPGDPELSTPFAEDLTKARAKALERRISPQQAGVRRVRGEMETLAQSMTNMKAAVQLKRAQRNLEAAERLLSAEVVDCSPSQHATAVGSQGEADRPACGGCSQAPLTERDIESMTRGEFDALNAEADHVVAVSLESAA